MLEQENSQNQNFLSTEFAEPKKAATDTKSKKNLNQKSPLIIGGILVSIIVLITLTLVWSRHSQPAPEPPELLQNESLGNLSTPPIPEELVLDTMFFGDIFWGRYMDDWSKKSEQKEAYPFSGLKTFEKDQRQVWIGNLECPVTTTYRTAAQQESNLQFSCLPEYLPEASKWFAAFSLANNHTDNMESVGGMRQTREFLEENDIQYFGHYDNAVKEDICEVVSLPVRVKFADKDSEEKYSNLLSRTSTESKQNWSFFKIPIALCGYHNVFKLPLESELQEIKTYSQLLPTFVMPHQGLEYKITADNYQRSYYRQMIDLGADAVFGGHNHAVQNTEAYKDKLIVYSMGNFIFDQQFSANVTQGVGINAKLTFVYNENLKNWHQLAESCEEFKDGCLKKAKELELEKPNFQIKYDFVPTDSSNKLTKKGSTELRQKLSRRMNWEQTMEGLK